MLWRRHHRAQKVVEDSQRQLAKLCHEHVNLPAESCELRLTDLKVGLQDLAAGGAACMHDCHLTAQRGWEASELSSKGSSISSSESEAEACG